jgi:peptidoglycan/xylan/chitin deacetylase (PgdA/CDA1 family)
MRSLLYTAAAAALLAACGTSPGPAGKREPASAPAAKPAAPGEVIARNDRFLIYLPQAGDTQRGIAARFLGSEDHSWQIAELNGTNRVEPQQPVVVPLQAVNPQGVFADHYQTVPILCYHRVGPGGGKMVVSTANFAAQMEWLSRNDYQVIRLSQLVGFLQGREALPRRSVVVTFDDGYESVHRNAFPVLKRLDLPATVFVYTDFLGAGDALNWAQLSEMQASGLIDIQAHSKSHRNLIERVNGESDDQYRRTLDAETRGPRELIERRVPTRVRHYAYPYGDANEAVLDALRRHQYELGVTVHPGGNPFFAQPLMLRRTMIYGDHSLDAFKLKLQTSRAIAAP